MPAPAAEEKVPTDLSTNADQKDAAMKEATRPTNELAPEADKKTNEDATMAGSKDTTAAKPNADAEAKANLTPVAAEANRTSAAKGDRPEAPEEPAAAQNSGALNDDSAAKAGNGAKSQPNTKHITDEEAKVVNGDATKATETNTEEEAANGSMEKKATETAEDNTKETVEKTGDGSEKAEDAKLKSEMNPQAGEDAMVDSGHKKMEENNDAPNGKEEDNAEKKPDVNEKEQVSDEKMDGVTKPKREENGDSGNKEKAVEEDKDAPKRPKVQFGGVEERTIEEEEEEYEPDEEENEEDGEEESGEEEEGEEGEINEDEPMKGLEEIPVSLASTLLAKGAVTGPLHVHASNGDVEELRKLLATDGEMEGKVDDRDVFEYTALHVAAEHDKRDACQVLLEHGANIEASTKMHDSKPIHYAAFEGHDEVITFLLERGANINSLTDDNRTPLYQAAMRGHDHCVKLLLDKGADRDLADKNGKKPVDVADKKAVVDLFVAPPAKKARTE